jgi:hypothetical protein
VPLKDCVSAAETATSTSNAAIHPARRRTFIEFLLAGNSLLASGLRLTIGCDFTAENW